MPTREERREHMERLAATIAAGIVCYDGWPSKGDANLTRYPLDLADKSFSAAKAITERVRRWVESSE